jgi:3-mercaptopyruvate sulfurtransferase SseA
MPAQLDDLHLDPTRPVIVVCGSGYRSSITSSLLQQRGYQEVWNTLGGMTAWQEAGLPTVRPQKMAAGARAEAPDRQREDEVQHLLRGDGTPLAATRR